MHSKHSEMVKRTEIRVSSVFRVHSKLPKEQALRKGPMYVVLPFIGAANSKVTYGKSSIRRTLFYTYPFKNTLVSVHVKTRKLL